MNMNSKNSASDSASKILLRPENNDKQYEALFLEISKGEIKLPMFQREFVWDKEQSAKLIDSMLKGYPIGTFIFWRTKETLRSYKEIGNHKLPESPEGEYVQYILDGQQRITSLYAIRRGLRITKDGKEIDYKDIFVNLDYDPKSDEQIVVTDTDDIDDYVSVYDILTKGMLSLFKGRSEDKAKLLEEYKNRLTTYVFPTVTIKNYPIEIACDVFSRINTGGKSLTLFEIMVAMTYDEKKKFDLALKYEELCNGTDDSKYYLAKAKYDTIPATTAMQTVAAITVQSIKAKDILKIRRALFIENWDNTVNAIFSAVTFLTTTMRIPVSQLLPYPSLVVPLAYFFHKNENRKPNEVQAKLLEQFFYWASITYRYSSATETKIGEDLKKMELILRSKRPHYAKDEITVKLDEVSGEWFSTGNAGIKAILCLFASRKPQNFDEDADVILDNSHLKIASSKNYHHFFPKDYLKKVAPNEEPNLIANITLIDAYSNNKIRANPPSKYIEKFRRSNKKLGHGLRSQLIGDLQAYGILDDDYPKFIRKRSEAIVSALNEKLNPNLTDAE